MPVLYALLLFVPSVVALGVGWMLGRKRQPTPVTPLEGQLWVLDGVGTVLVVQTMTQTCLYVVVEPMVGGWELPKKTKCQVRIADFVAAGRLLERPPALGEVLEGIRERACGRSDA